jgi:hypothetical protein
VVKDHKKRDLGQNSILYWGFGGCLYGCKTWQGAINVFQGISDKKIYCKISVYMHYSGNYSVWFE